jgi:thiamine transport system substrate-binding protein
MMSPGFQDLIPTNNWMLPAGETKTALPDAFKSVAKPTKTLLFSPEEVLKNRRAWTDEWRNALSK